MDKSVQFKQTLGNVSANATTRGLHRGMICGAIELKYKHSTK